MIKWKCIFADFWALLLKSLSRFITCVQVHCHPEQVFSIHVMKKLHWLDNCLELARDVTSLTKSDPQKETCFPTPPP